MKKIFIFILLAIFLSGCATYKFEKEDKGYLVSYDAKSIPEYTVGKDKSLPGLDLAKERFNRRRKTVEYYCKQMGEIESRFKEYLWDTPGLLVDFLFGIIRWPYTAISDYKYNHNPKYKEKIDALDEQKDELAKARVKAWRDKLDAYLKEDLAKELPVAEKPVTQGEAAPAPKAVTAQPAAAVKKQPQVITAKEEKEVIPAPETKPAEIKEPTVSEPKPLLKEVAPELTLESPVAIIIAKPVKGPSPLRVNFYGNKSRSKNSRIVSYNWDFGDGDTSTLKNPVNIYWSVSYGSRKFTATLTVKDEKGMSSQTTQDIEVITQ